MSLPIVYEKTIGHRQGISASERDAKIKLFETYVKTLNRQIKNETNLLFHESQNEDNAFQTNLKKTTHFYYFIGRLNPTHYGHLNILNNLVQTANRNNSVPLILLGSGPKGERTLENPITYELKTKFIRSQLPGNYILKEMKSPAADVSQFIKMSLINKISPVDNIIITHVAGDKAEDSIKLNFIKPIARNAALSVAQSANINTITDAIVPISIQDVDNADDNIQMSATHVRKDAYRYFLDGSGLDSFTLKYGWFYKSFTADIYQQIIDPAMLLSRDQIINYIEDSTYSKPSSTRKRTSSKISKSRDTSSTRKRVRKT